MRKQSLTLNDVRSRFYSLKALGLNQDEHIIKRWKYPLLWLLWLLKGYKIRSDNWLFYWVDFRGIKYLIKSIMVEKI